MATIIASFTIKDVRERDCSRVIVFFVTAFILFSFCSDKTAHHKSAGRSPAFQNIYFFGDTHTKQTTLKNTNFIFLEINENKDHTVSDRILHTDTWHTEITYLDYTQIFHENFFPVLKHSRSDPSAHPVTASRGLYIHACLWIMIQIWNSLIDSSK